MKWIKPTFFFVFAFAAISILIQPSLNAHPFNIGVIRTKLAVEDKQIMLSGETSPQTTVTADHTKNKREAFEQYVTKNLIIKNQDKECSFKMSDFRLVDSNKVSYGGTYSCTDNIAKLSDLNIRSTMFVDFYEKFEHFVDLENGSEKVQIIFNKDKQEYPESKTENTDQSQAKPNDESGTQEEKPDSSLGTIAKEFTRIGAEHIWFGYDHVLFLIMLVLLLRSFTKIIKIVTAFTIAHSVTLLLAGFDIITISPDIIEPIIALTIVFVAVQNLIRIKKKEINQHSREGWMIAAGFGLIHGLGFAGALKELEIPREHFVPSLIFFNVGVELGQIVLLLLIVPILLLIDKTKWKYRLLAAIATIVGIQAFVWFVQRII